MDDLCRVRGKSVPLPPSDDESLTDPTMDGADDASFHGDDDDYVVSSSDESVASIEPQNLRNEIEDIHTSTGLGGYENGQPIELKTRPSRRIRKVPASIKNSSQDFTYSTPSSRSLTEDGSNSTEPISTGSSEQTNDIDYIGVQSTTITQQQQRLSAASKPVPRKKITIGKKGKINSKKRSFDSYRKKRSSPKNKFKNNYVPATFATSSASILLQDNTKDTDSKSADDGNENKLILCSNKENFVLTQDCCVTCGSFGKDEEGRLLSCSQCGQCYHTFCAGVTNISKTMLHKGWRCLECTVCEGCGKPTDESRLLLCDECDISYHTYCLNPPLENVPQGTWKCKWCVVCLNCGSTSPGQGSQWESNYTLCGPCASQELCSICKDVYKENDLIIQCRQCNRWLHAKCDQMTDEDDCEIASCLEFACANCRSPDEAPCHIQARKNKALKTMLQKRAEQRAESAASMSDKSLQVEVKKEVSESAPAVAIPVTVNPEVRTKYHYSDGVYLTDTGNHAIKSLAIEPVKKARNKRKNLQNGKEEDDKDEKDEAVELSAEEKKLKQKQQKLEKLGIGGFFIKQRGRLTSSKDELEEDPERSSTPDGDKPKRKRRNTKKKQQLSDMFPVYLQEAFFGKNILADASAEYKISDNEDDECDLKSDNKSNAVNVSLDLPLSDSLDTVEDVDDEMNFLDANMPGHHDELGPGENFDFDLMNMIFDDGQNDGLLSELTNNDQEDAEDRGDLGDLNLDSDLNFGDNFLDSIGEKDVEDIFNDVLSDTSLTKSQDAFSDLEPSGSKLGEQTSQIMMQNQSKVELPPLVSHSLHTQQSQQQQQQSQQQHPQMSLPNHIPSQIAQQSTQQQQQQQRPQQQFASIQHSGQVHYDQNIPSVSQHQMAPQNPQMQHSQNLYQMPQQQPQHSQPQSAPQQSQQIPHSSPAPGQSVQDVQNQWQDSSSNQDSEPSEMSQNQKNTIKWEAEELLGDMATISPVLYANKNHPNLKAEFPLWSERVKQISKLWRGLNTDQRSPYLQLARDNRASNRLMKSQNEAPKKQEQQQQQQQQQTSQIQGQQSQPTQQQQIQQPPTPTLSQQPMTPKQEQIYDPYSRPVPTPSMYSPVQPPPTPRPPMQPIMQPRPPAPIQSPMSPMLQSPRMRPPHFQQQTDFRQAQTQPGSFSPASVQVQESAYHSNPGTPQSGADINYKVASPYASNPRTPGMTPFSPMVHQQSQDIQPFGGPEQVSQQDMYKMPPNMNSKPHTPDSFHQSMPSTPQPNSPALLSAQSPVDIYARSPATPATGKAIPSDGFPSQQQQQWNQTQNFSPSYNPDGYVNSPGPRPQMRPPVMQPRIPGPPPPIRRSISVADPYARQPMTPMPGQVEDINDPSKQQHLRNLLQVNQMRRQDSLPATPSPRPNWNDSGFRQPMSPAMARPRAPFPMDQQQRMQMAPRPADPRFRIAPQQAMQRFPQQQTMASQQPNMMSQQPQQQQHSPQNQQQQWLKPIQQQGLPTQSLPPSMPSQQQQQQQMLHQDAMMGMDQGHMQSQVETFDSLPVELGDEDLFGLEDNLELLIGMASPADLQKDQSGVGDMKNLQKSDSIDSSQSESLSLSENDYERLLNSDMGQPMQSMQMQPKPHPPMQPQQQHFQPQQQMFQHQHAHQSPSHQVPQGQIYVQQQAPLQPPPPSQTDMYGQPQNQWQDPNVLQQQQQQMRNQQNQQQFQQAQFAQRVRMPMAPGQVQMQRHPMMQQQQQQTPLPLQQQQQAYVQRMPIQQPQQPQLPLAPPPPQQHSNAIRPSIPPPQIPEPSMIADHNRHLLVPYEQWLVIQHQNLSQTIKHFDDQVKELRKTKKSLNAKQRAAKKNQSDMDAQDTEALNRVTAEITVIQKKLEASRKQLRQHTTTSIDYKSKYSPHFPVPGEQSPKPAAVAPPPMQASPRPVNSPMAALNVSNPNTPHGIGSTPQSPAIPSHPSPGHLMQNSPMTPILTPQSPMGQHGPQIVQDDNNPFSDGFMQKEKKHHQQQPQQVVKQPWMNPAQQQPLPQQHYSPNSGYSEPNPNYYQQQPIQQQIQPQPQQFQQMQRPPMAQQQHYVQQNDQYRQFQQQPPSTQPQQQQQHYVQQQQNAMQYQQQVRRPPPPPYPGKIPQQQQQQPQQFVPRAQIQPQGQYMRTQMVMQQQQQHMQMQSPQHQQMMGGMQEMSGESFSFSYIEDAILEGNGSDPVSFQNEMIQQNGCNVSFSRETSSQISQTSQNPQPTAQHNDIPVEVIKAEMNPGTNGLNNNASSDTAVTPTEEPKEKQNNALLKQLLQNCPAADDKVADSNSVGSSHSRTSTPTIPVSGAVPLPQPPPQVSLPASHAPEEIVNQEVKSESESSFQMNQSISNDIANGDMSNVSMESTNDSADSIQVVQEKKLTYLELRKEQLLKEPTPPPSEHKPKRKRATKRKEKSVEDVNENSNSSSPATATPKVKVKRARKGSQNHRPEENGTVIDTNEQQMQQILKGLKEFPALTIIQPKISHNFNFCLPPDAPDMNSKVPRLKGAFGDAQPLTGFDYYSTLPFGPNKSTPPIANYPSSTNALLGKTEGNTVYFEEFSCKLPNLDEHLKERGDIFKNYSLYSRDLNSPDTVVSCSSPESMFGDDKNEFNTMKFINEFYEDENKNSIERSDSPVLYMPITIPSLKSSDLDENKENIQDIRDNLKDYSNLTLMVRVEDPKSVIDSLAKILGIDETLIMYEFGKRNEFDVDNKSNNDDDELKTMAVSLDEVLSMELEDNEIEEKEVAQIFEKENKSNEIVLSSDDDEAGVYAAEAVGNISLDEKKWKDQRYFYWKPNMFKKENNETDAEDDKVGKELDHLQICIRKHAESVDKRMCLFCKGVGDSDIDGPSRLLNMDVDKWVHLNCALWSAEVVELLNGALMHVQKEFRRACKEKCVCCGQLGASLRCFRMKCTNQYHFPCATKSKCMFFKDKSIFCHLHAPKSTILPNPDEMTSFAVWRKVFINREESSQIASMLRTGHEDYSMRIGSLIFLNIGQLLPHQLEAFHTASYIYPVGYKISRFYWSTRTLGRRCRYICSIHEIAAAPEFQIEIIEDDQGNVVFKDKTAKGAWNQVITPIRKLRETSNTIKVFNDFITGEDLFGLNEPTIVRILESLPGVDQLTDYNFKFGRSPFYELPLAINPSGSARTEVFMKCHFKRPHTLRAPPTSSKTFQTAIVTTLEPSSPYVKQFVHSKLSQYRKMKLEWRSNVYLARSRIAGLGLYAKREIEKHTMIIEYIGLVIRNEVSERNERIHEEHKRGIYMFRLDENRVIDATLEGGLARYINHSCDPNCVAELVQIERENKILIIANRKIMEGEELSYDYKFEIEDDQHKIPCMCGAANCRKWMN